MGKLKDLRKLGQSIWLDYISRELIQSGELKMHLKQGVRGVTSNPTIFEKAIVGSADYDEQIKAVITGGANLDELYEALILEDIRLAAKRLRGLWRRSKHVDGYVSVEVSPELAWDTNGTIDEGLRLFHTLRKPNVMIKVPATLQGIAAIAALTGEGVNVNATLIFSHAQYETVVRAYIEGLTHYINNGGELKNVASVASIFVSRVDTAVDSLLEKKGETELQGKIAIANAKSCVKLFQRIYSGNRWKLLAKNGARVQRLLWASTGTKNPAYPDTLYLDSLIGRHTVNTVPPATLDAFLDHGTVASTLDADLDGAVEQLDKLAKLGIDLEEITETLQLDGVNAFTDSYNSLRSAIEEKAKRLG